MSIQLQKSGSSPSRGNNNRKSKLTATSSKQKFPKVIRDKLCMTCALHGYSTIRTGGGMTIKQQRDLMEEFFYSIPGKNPSQIQMLSEAKVEYADLYDTTEVRNVTKKSSGSKNSNKTTTTRTYLKQSISKDDSAFYYVGTDITYRDLRLKNRKGTLLLNGRQLLDMAKKGMKGYWKVMAFTSDTWNLKKREPIESGTTVADVIEYIRWQMYLNKKGIDAEEEDDAIAEVEIMKERNENDSKKKVNENDESKNNSDEDDEDVEKGNADNNVGDDDDDDVEDDNYDDDAFCRFSTSTYSSSYVLFEYRRYFAKSICPSIRQSRKQRGGGVYDFEMV